MYLHKYKIESDTFYRISSEVSKPSGTIMLSVANWKGRVPGSGKIKSSLQIIEKAFKEEPEKPKEPEKKVPEESKPEEEKKKKVALAERIREFALKVSGE